jgi:hypothetical protein
MCAHSDYTVDNRATVQGLLKSKPYSTYKELREKEPKESFFLYDSCDPNVPCSPVPTVLTVRLRKLFTA